MRTHNKHSRSTKKNRKLFSLAVLWACLALLWAYFVLLAPAFGAETMLSRHSINFKPPTGHCLLNESEPSERKAIEALQQIQKPDGNVIWMFADCDELALLRAGKSVQLKRYGQVMAVQPTGVFQPIPGMSRFEFTQHLGRNIPVLEISRVARNAPGRTAAPQAPSHRLLHFGLATIDAAAAYAGLLVENNLGRARSVTAGVMALTLVKDLPVAVVIYGPYGELADYRALRNQLRPIVGDFIAGNDTSGGAPRLMNAESEAWDISLDSLTRIDWNKALLGGLLSLGFATVIFFAARRSRG